MGLNINILFIATLWVTISVWVPFCCFVGGENICFVTCLFNRTMHIKTYIITNQPILN